jgi:predicted nuclease of predicted toxin-antitoxin system
VKFLVDAQLLPALVRVLAEAGHEAQHVEEAGLRHAKDGLIWNHSHPIGGSDFCDGAC